MKDYAIFAFTIIPIQLLFSDKVLKCVTYYVKYIDFSSM